MSKRLRITGVQLLNYGKNKAVGSATFSAPALQEIGTKDMSLHEALGCQEEFADWMPKGSIDGDLLIQSFELLPYEKQYRDHALIGSNEITGCKLYGFSFVRLELKGTTGQGKRFEYRFHLSFSDPLGLMKLEGLYNAVPERPLVINASYTRQAVQQSLLDPPSGDDGNRVDVKSGEVVASPEAMQSVLAGLEEDAEREELPTTEGPGMTAAEKKAARLSEESKKKALREAVN